MEDSGKEEEESGRRRQVGNNNTGVELRRKRRPVGEDAGGGQCRWKHSGLNERSKQNKAEWAIAEAVRPLPSNTLAAGKSGRQWKKTGSGRQRVDGNT